MDKFAFHRDARVTTLSSQKTEEDFWVVGRSVGGVGGWLQPSWHECMNQRLTRFSARLVHADLRHLMRLQPPSSRST